MSVRLLLDENFAPKLCAALGQHGVDAIHVGDIGLLGARDPIVLQAGSDHDRTVVTYDSDYGTLLARHRLTRPSVLYLRLPEGIEWEPLVRLLSSLVALHRDALLAGSLVTHTVVKTRVTVLPIQPRLRDETSNDPVT